MATWSGRPTKPVAPQTFRGRDHVVGLFATKKPGATRIINTRCTWSFGREQTEQNASGREYLVRLVGTKRTRRRGFPFCFNCQR